jgi:5-enolpyruvylshikimate-3-phosphate synthase
MFSKETKTTLTSRLAPIIDTEIAVPPDKSISHRAVLLASLSNGPCVIRNFLEGEDCRSTAQAMRQLGHDDAPSLGHPRRSTLRHPAHR